MKARMLLQTVCARPGRIPCSTSFRTGGEAEDLKVWSNSSRSFLMSKAFFMQRFYHDREGGSAAEADRPGCNYMGKTLLPNDEVSPLDETALARQLKIPSNVRLETSRLGPKMTGPTKSKGCRGMRLQSAGDTVRIRGGTHLRGREFPRSPEGARTPIGPLAFEGRASRKRK